MRSILPHPARLVPALLLLATIVSAPAPARAQEVVPEEPGDVQRERMMDPRDYRHAIYLMQHERLWQGARAHRAKALAERAAAKKAKRASRKPGAKPELVQPNADTAPLATRELAPFTSDGTTALPANVRANDPTADVASAAQSEISLAALGRDLVISWNDGQVGVGAFQGVATSSNAGASFTDTGVPPAITGGWTYARWVGDPVVAVDESADRFYLAGMAQVDHNSTIIADSCALVVAARFQFFGWTWGPGRVVRALNNTDWLLDKEWIAADSTNGNVYIVYTLFNLTANLNYIQFQRSTDGGATWSTPYTLSSLGDAGDVQGARVVTGPDGTVHVVWIHNNPTTGLYDLRYRRSTNTGTNWSAEVTPTSWHPLAGTGPPGFNRGRAVNFPSLAVDRTTGAYRGRVYVGYSEVYDFLDETWPAQPAASTVRFESESNNTSGTADAFTAGNVLRGAVTTSDDDWWSVSLTAGQHLELWADSTNSAINVDFDLTTFAPDAATKLAFAGLSSFYATASPAYWVVYAPVSGTYYLRVGGNTTAATGYRIRSRIGQTDGGFSRDRRDPFVLSTDNGTTWTTPKRVTSGAVGSDDSFPEIAVGGDGFVYATWLDERDDFYRAATCAYVGHSVDGGATWGTNARLSTVATNFTTTPANIAPNMGDYIGLAAGATVMHAAWPDGRLGTVDVYTSSFGIASGFQNCITSQLAPALGTVSLTREFQNGHDYATNQYTWHWTDTRGWLQSELTVPFSLAPDEVVSLPGTVTIPANAAQGSFDDVCLTVTNQTGALVMECCTRITVSGTLADVEGSGASFALHAVTPNPVASRATVRFALPRAGAVSLAIYDVTGARVRTLVNGERAAGEHSATWDGRDDGGRRLGAGAYFVKLASGDREATRRVVLLQ